MQLAVWKFWKKKKHVKKSKISCLRLQCCIWGCFDLFFVFFLFFLHGSSWTAWHEKKLKKESWVWTIGWCGPGFGFRGPRSGEVPEGG
jgi:hypothetical protein